MAIQHRRGISGDGFFPPNLDGGEANRHDGEWKKDPRMPTNDDTIRALREAMELSPDNLALRRHLANCWSRPDDWTSAPCCCMALQPSQPAEDRSMGTRYYHYDGLGSTQLHMYTHTEMSNGQVKCTAEGVLVGCDVCK